MKFTPEQVAQLSAKLSTANVKERKQGGRQVSYIEGWHAIAEANRVFGFDAWSRETVDLKCVAEGERAIGDKGAKGFGVSYIAKVRITIEGLVREGCGTGHGIDRDLGQAHESAVKEAETDAMKRALMTFGNIFGLALYDKEQSNVADPVDESVVMYLAACNTAISAATDPSELLRWWNSDEEKANRRAFNINAMQLADLKQSVKAKLDQLKTMQKDAA